MKLTLSLLALVLIALCTTLQASAQSKPRLVVLPFRVVGVDTLSSQTAIATLRRELDRGGKYDVIEEGRTPIYTCNDVACAVEAAATVKADRVVYGSVSKLGTKLLMDYTLAEVSTGKRIIASDVSAFSFEDLQSMMGNVAKSVVAEKPAGEIAIESRTTASPTTVLNRPKYSVAAGVGVGQLYPQSGYPELKRAFVLDVRAHMEYPRYSLNLLGCIRYGLLLNFGASYYLTQTAIAPYIGASVGYHLVAHDPSRGTITDSPIASGFNGMGSVGVVFNRTGDIRFFINGDYMLTLNDYDDKAFVLTLGIMGISDGIRF